MPITASSGETDEEFAVRLQREEQSSSIQQRRTSSAAQQRPQPTMRPTSDGGKEPVTCCDRFLSCVSLWGLHVINIFDCMVGSMLLVISLILFANLGDSTTDIRNTWLAYMCLILGCLLIMVAAFSALGVLCSCCRCSAVFSSYIAMGVGLICIVLSIIFLALKQLILEYFEKDGLSLGLSSKDISLTETWYTVIDVSLFFVAGLELIRYLASVKFAEISTKIDSEETTPLLGRNMSPI